MPLKEGDIYTCTGKDCNCEIKVINGCSEQCDGESDLTCCCGKPMERIS